MSDIIGCGVVSMFFPVLQDGREVSGGSVWQKVSCKVRSITQSVKYLPCKCEDPSSIPHHLCENPNLVVSVVVPAPGRCRVLDP